MTLIENRQITQLIIVFIGDFNPVIVQPLWLSVKGLIRKAEEEQAVIEFVHKDLTKFKLDWVDFQVTGERFEMKCVQEPYFEALKDLAIGIWRNLPGTPIRSFGINHLRHYLLESSEKYYQFGNTIAPLRPWEDLFEDPRLWSLEIVTDKNKEGVKRIRVQPSDSETMSGKPAIMFNLNDHYQIRGNESLKEIDPITVLIDKWKSSFGLADKAEILLEKLLRQ